MRRDLVSFKHLKGELKTYYLSDLDLFIFVLKCYLGICTWEFPEEVVGIWYFSSSFYSVNKKDWHKRKHEAFTVLFAFILPLLKTNNINFVKIQMYGTREPNSALSHVYLYGFNSNKKQFHKLKTGNYPKKSPWIPCIFICEDRPNPQKRKTQNQNQNTEVKSELIRKRAFAN